MAMNSHYSYTTSAELIGWRPIELFVKIIVEDNVIVFVVLCLPAKQVHTKSTARKAGEADGHHRKYTVFT